jgi:hypothetical protein
MNSSQTKLFDIDDTQMKQVNLKPQAQPRDLNASIQKTEKVKIQPNLFQTDEEQEYDPFIDMDHLDKVKVQFEFASRKIIPFD